MCVFSKGNTFQILHYEEKRFLLINTKVDLPTQKGAHGLRNVQNVQRRASLLPALRVHRVSNYSTLVSFVEFKNMCWNKCQLHTSSVDLSVEFATEATEQTPQTFQSG